MFNDYEGPWWSPVSKPETVTTLTKLDTITARAKLLVQVQISSGFFAWNNAPQSRSMRPRRSFEHHTGDSTIWLVSTPILREDTWGWSGASHLSSSSTNHARGLAARRLFIVPSCREGTIHLQTSMSSPEFEPSPYGTAVSVANHYTGWATLYSCKSMHYVYGCVNSNCRAALRMYRAVDDECRITEFFGGDIVNFVTIHVRSTSPDMMLVYEELYPVQAWKKAS
ncbi:hypothetical protein TNCV_1569091 [Trichonephila clavipes]|nr:hypothetical protein TNCV_1569091 [Trichonephila clavipes]